MIHLTFHCPKCGTTLFGSASWKGPEGPLTRYCHGGTARDRCTFWWPEKDDWKYFTVDGKKVGQKAYQAAEKKIRETPIYGTE